MTDRIEKTLAEFDTLYKISDLTEEEYNTAKKQYLQTGMDKKLYKHLLSRSKLPNLRNLVRPCGERYAPVSYSADYIVKYVLKPSWGADGMILVICLWELLVIDIDDKQQLPYIKKRIDRYYPNELWYIHETARGYHLYMVSRTVNHASKYAIYVRKKLNCDPAYGSNSLYSGSSIRLTRKKWDPEGVVSKYLESYGNGQANPEALRLYNIVVYWLQRATSDTIVDWSNIWSNMPSDFGKVHIAASAPLLLNDGVCSSNVGEVLWNNDVAREWRRFIKYQTIPNLSHLPLLLFGVQFQMGMDNLYRILESTQDYAIGIHVQHNTYFISYRDLLFVDYDYKPRRAIIARFCRSNAGYVFRLVQTNKGYHAFLTSHPMVHNSTDSIEMLYNLRTDPAHLLGVYYRGYSVRVNKKYSKESPYREVARYGTGREDERLLALYQKHLDLYNKNDRQALVCNYQLKIASDIFHEEGPMKVF